MTITVLVKGKDETIVCEYQNVVNITVNEFIENSITIHYSDGYAQQTATFENSSIFGITF